MRCRRADRRRRRRYDDVDIRNRKEAIGGKEALILAGKV